MDERMSKESKREKGSETYEKEMRKQRGATVGKKEN